MGFHGNRMRSHEIHGGHMGLRSEKRMERIICFFFCVIIWEIYRMGPQLISYISW